MSSRLEIEVLQSIYPELVSFNDGHSISIDIQVAFDRPVDVKFETFPTCQVRYLPPLRVNLDLPKDYPEAEPPAVHLQCLWLESEVLQELATSINALWQPGDEVLYMILDHLSVASEDAFGKLKHEKVDGDCLQLPDTLRRSILEHQTLAARADFEKLSYECEICLDWKAGRSCVSLLCGHVYCKECLHDMFSLHIKEGSVSSIRCPSCPISAGRPAALSAPAEAVLAPSRDPMKYIPVEILQSIVSKEEVVRYQKLLRKQELEVMNSTFCPRDFCATTLARDPDEKLVVCTECEYAFCADCRKGWHGPTEPCRRLMFSSSLGELYLSLQEDKSKVSELKALERLYGIKNLQRLVRDLEDEKLADKWRQENAQSCPVCSVSVEKSMGCNHMICGVCNTHFCFLCGEGLSQRNPYSHYSDKGISCYGKLFEGLTGLEDPFGAL